MANFELKTTRQLTGLQSIARYCDFADDSMEDCGYWMMKGNNRTKQVTMDVPHTEIYAKPGRVWSWLENSALSTYMFER